jgi:hypothetical protein
MTGGRCEKSMQFSGAKYDLRLLEIRTRSTRLKVYKFKRLSLKQGLADLIQYKN